MEARSDCSGGWEPGEGRQDPGSARGCVKVKRRVRAAGGGAAARRAGRAVSAPGRGARGAAGGREGAAAGGAGGGRSGRAGRPRWGRGAGGRPRRRRAGLAPDLTFWVRACVQEARWGRGRGREAVQEVPGWLASAPFSLSLLPAPEETGPQGPRREAGGVLPAGSRQSHPGPGDTSFSGPEGCLRRGPGSSLRAAAPRPSGESRRRLFRDRGWVRPWLDGPSPLPLPLVVSGACGTEGRESGNRASCTVPELA